MSEDDPQAAWAQLAELHRKAAARNYFPPQREWIVWPGLAVYVRYSKAIVENGYTPICQIASVSADTMGEGAFSRWLPEFEQAAGTPLVEVECVQEKRFMRFLERQGYAPKPGQQEIELEISCTYRKSMAEPAPSDTPSTESEPDLIRPGNT